MKQLLTLILALSSASSVMADEYTCYSEGTVRLVSVEYDHSGWDVPCSVKYEKPDEGVVEYPWRAESTPGYCERKAQFLVSKLENWGWRCEKSTSP